MEEGKVSEEWGSLCNMLHIKVQYISLQLIKNSTLYFPPLYQDCDEAAARYLNFRTIWTHLVCLIIVMIIRLLLLFLSLTQQSIGTPPILSTSPWLHCKRVQNDDGRAEHN